MAGRRGGGGWGIRGVLIAACRGGKGCGIRDACALMAGSIGGGGQGIRGALMAYRQNRAPIIVDAYSSFLSSSRDIELD
jgi:hypothetical protein